MDPRPADREPDSGTGADEALRRLEERLAKVSEAAERLVADAAGRAERAAGPPPSGWQQPTAGDDARSDLELLSQILGSLRELIPPELQRRLADALQELLMAMRALIDWYLERSDRKRSAPAEVRDIPIL
jgi:hypothetical protein